VAHLARLELTEEEKIQYQQQLSAVLDHVAALDELDLKAVPPTAHAVSQHNVLRDDVARPSLPLAAVLRNAPEHAQQQFLIQSILAA
jgi:aspartyl-tRNA(Asn)/glutamyl-tRNA(Gln) amidotransferase subunit C